MGRIEGTALFVLWLVVGCRSGGQRAVGQLCEADSECSSGLCLDLATTDDGCRGRVCTQPCQRTRDCPRVAAGPDCDPVRGRDTQVCLYGAWQQQYCRRR